MKPIYIINGPNLDMLGKRETDIYGKVTIDDIEQYCHKLSRKLHAKIVFRQSNFEGEIVETIHEALEKSSAVIINPAAFSHYSIAILDALKIITQPKIEVHLTNISKREKMRQKSITAPEMDGVIYGLSYIGYGLAIRATLELLNENQ